MLTLDYRIHRDASADDVAWDRIDDVSLGYWRFLGDIVLTTDDADHSMRWGWLPILGFALQMTNAAHVIQRGEPHTLEILGSERCLHFAPRGNRIEIVTDDSERPAFVSAQELVLMPGESRRPSIDGWERASATAAAPAAAGIMARVESHPRRGLSPGPGQGR